MTGSRDVNLDTSVLLGYVYTELPGELADDEDCVRVLESGEFYCVVGGKVAGEFDALCDRRRDLYDDLLDWLADNPGKSVYDYDLAARDLGVSDNDMTHVRYEVQREWAAEPRRKQLSELRRCMQDLATFQELVPDELLDRVYEQAENSDLRDALAGLDLGHDREVVVDAVEINRRDGIDTLVSKDSDVTDAGEKERINEAIRDAEDGTVALTIRRPAEL